MFTNCSNFAVREYALSSDLPSIYIYCVSKRSSDPFYVVTYYIKWVTTSWTWYMEIE